MSELDRKTLYGFSVGDLGGNLFFSLIGFIFIFFLTEQLGLSGTMAGAAMMIGKICDAVTDPIVSSFSDRSKSRHGRRRPFIFWGALLLFVTMILTFSIPRFENSFITFIVATLLFCLLCLSYTLVNIPYSSLQPELTSDYNEKTKLTMIRMSFAIFGTILAVLARPLAEFFGFNNHGWTIMAFFMGLIMLISSWITVFSVKEKNCDAYKKQKGVIESYYDAFTNREFLFALIPWMLFVTAVTVIQGSFLYYFKYIHKAATYFEFTLFGLIFVSLFTFFFWFKISKRVSKSVCYSIGMSFFALSLLVSYFLSPIFGPVFTTILISISGIGFSTHYIMPHSIIPDVIELDSKRSGIRREGIYYAIWNFLMKCGQAFAGLLIGITLDKTGFIPPISNSSIIAQTDSALKGISFLCGPIPVILIIAGVIVLRFYPINRVYYKEALERI